MASNNFKISKDKGTGSGSFTVTANTINTTGSDRKAQITVTNGGKTVNIPVLQFYAPTITADGTIPALIPSSGGTYTYTINSHYDYMFGGIPDWITLKFADGTVIQNNTKYSSGFGVKVTMTIDANTSFVDRTASGFIFGHYYLDGTIARRTLSMGITQAGATEYLFVSYTLTHCTKPENAPTAVERGGTFTVTLTPDTDYRMLESGYYTDIKMGGEPVLNAAKLNDDGTLTITINNVSGYISIKCEGMYNRYSVTYSLLNATKPSDAPTSIVRGGSFNVTLSPADKYKILNGDVTFMVGEILCSGRVVYNADGTATISYDGVYNDIKVIVIASKNEFNITYSTVHTNKPSDAPTTITRGERLYLTFTPETGYDYYNAQIMMSNQDVTAAYFNELSLTLDIPQVTGDVNVVIESKEPEGKKEYTLNLSITGENVDLNGNIMLPYTASLVPGSMVLPQTFTFDIYCEVRDVIDQTTHKTNEGTITFMRGQTGWGGNIQDLKASNWTEGRYGEILGVMLRINGQVINYYYMEKTKLLETDDYIIYIA